MESRAKSKLKNKDNNNKTRFRELPTSLSLQLSPCCALPVSLSSLAEHLGEGGERYGRVGRGMGGWGLKLALVVQKSATLRIYILLFLSMLRSNLANLLTLRLFSQTVLWKKCQEIQWHAGFLVEQLTGFGRWRTIQSYLTICSFTYLSGYIVWSGVRRCNGVQVGIILLWSLLIKEMDIVVVVVVCNLCHWFKKPK